MSPQPLLDRYPDEASAERYFTRKRWPDGVCCPGCNSRDVQRGTQSGRRRQLWYCRECGRMFSVTVGTIMEDTKLPLLKWLLAFDLMGPGKDGVSVAQLSCELAVSYKTAWKLWHRIRDAGGSEGTGVGWVQ